MKKLINILVILGLVITISSCEDNMKIEDEQFGLENQEMVVAKQSNSRGDDPCSGPGGKSISMTGNKVLKPGKYQIKLSISQNDDWEYGFSKIIHKDTDNSKGRLHWRVVKRQRNLFKEDEWKLHESCKELSKGEDDSYMVTTADLNKASDGGDWTYVYLEIIVIDKNVEVQWSSFNKQGGWYP